jgi:hypothetical protein
MKIDNVPELAGEWKYRLGEYVALGEKYYFGDSWVTSVANGPISRTIIATPGPSPLLKWNEIAFSEYVRSSCCRYRCLRSEMGWASWHSGDGQPLGHCISAGWSMLSEAKTHCQVHADKMHKDQANQ